MGGCSFKTVNSIKDKKIVEMFWILKDYKDVTTKCNTTP